MSGPEPYFSDGTVTLYLGDMREVLPALAAGGLQADCIVTDPPYGETTLAWDRWPDGWPGVAAQASRSLWCFGSMRMFGEHWAEFGAAGWKFSQDIVWEKPNGSMFTADRFKRVHEAAAHWYRGDWAGICHETPRSEIAYRTKGNSGTGRGPRTQHTGAIASRAWEDDGTRLMRSVITAASMWRRGAIHPTEKPSGILTPLIGYACPAGGTVLDPFAGSGSTLDTARLSGRRAVGIEAREEYAEKAARRLSQMTLDFGGEGGSAA